MASNQKRLQTISFLVLLLAVFILVFYIFRPFISLLSLGLILAILFRPLYLKILHKVKVPGIASGLTVLVIILLIVVPLWFFGQIIFNEILSIYNSYRTGGFVISQDQIIKGLPPEVKVAIEHFSSDINAFIGRLSSEVFASFSAIISNIAGFFLATFMLFFIVFFLLRDGDKIKSAFMDISPISTEHEAKLFDRIVGAINGVVKGAFLMALIQGAVATIGYFIFGLPQPFIWGMFTVLTALVPNIGTSLTIIPAVIYLAVTGQTPQAIGMAIWGTFAVGLIDNFVGPRIVGNAVRLHPILVLLSVIGGLKFFGAFGFLIGPIVLAIFMTMVDLYRTDFKEYLQK